MGVGKSTLVLQLMSSRIVEEYDPTIEDSYRRQFCIDDRLALLHVWDAVHDEEFGDLMSQQKIRDCGCFILVYSIIRRASLEYLEEVFVPLLRSTKPYAPVMVVGAKSDLEDQRQVSAGEGKAFAERIGAMGFYEASAPQLFNVYEPFYDLVRIMRCQDDLAAQVRKAALTLICIRKFRPKKSPLLGQLPLEIVVMIARWVYGARHQLLLQSDNWRRPPPKKCAVQ
jgi:GTPase SAR1 family protein